MKRLKKFLVGAAIAVIALIGAGCGGTLSTNFTLNKDMSGQRVMTFTSNKAEDSDHILEDPSIISAAVAQATPEGLTFTDESTDADIIYKFTISFTDIEDYSEKLLKLMPEYDETQGPVVEYRVADSVFESGVYINENFTSRDIMSWFPTFLAEKGFIAESDTGNIFYNTSTAFDIFGDIADLYTERIRFDSLQTLSLGNIDFRTKINLDGTVNRSITVNIPKATMDANGDEIKAFMEAGKRSFASDEWTVDDYGNSIYKIWGENLSAEDVNEVMVAFYDKEGSEFFKLTPSLAMAPEQYVGKTPFYISYDISEKPDLTRYSIGYDAYVNFNYYLDIDGWFIGTMENEYGESSVFLSEYFDDSYAYICSRDPNPKVDINYIKTLPVSYANMTLNVKPDGSVSRTIGFTLDTPYNENLAADLRVRMGNIFDAAGVGSSFKSYVVDGANNEVMVDMEVEAAAEDEPGLWNAAFGLDNKLSVETKKNSFIAFTEEVEVNDSFYLGYLAPNEIPKLSYSVEGVGEIQSSTPANDGDKNHYETSIDNVSQYSPVKVSVVGERINFVMVGILIGVAVVIAIIAIVVAVIIAKSAKKKRMAGPVAAPVQAPVQAPVNAPEQEKAPTEAPVQEAPAETKPEAPATKFCTNCGAKIPATAGFCTICGSKQ